MSRTAVVILNWNGLDYLKRFLGKVVTFSQDPGTLVYVADNGSTDSSAEWISQNEKDVNIIRLEKNYGFAEGYNLALEKIKADFYILLNSDVEVTAGWIKPLLSMLESSNIAACQPKILSYAEREFFEYAGAAGGFIDKYGYPFCRGRIFDKVEKDLGQYDDPVNVFWSTGACMAVRADAWHRCGGFDPDFFAHMEEIDLCWRFQRAGYQIRYVPSSAVYHVGGGVLPYNSPLKTFLNFRNSLFLLYKNADEKSFRKILFIRKMLDGLAAMMFIFRGKPVNAKAVWRAHLDYYRHSAHLREKRKTVRNLGPDNFNAPVLNKSIVFQFYAKGIKTYSRLMQSTK